MSTSLANPRRTKLDIWPKRHEEPAERAPERAQEKPKPAAETQSAAGR